MIWIALIPAFIGMVYSGIKILIGEAEKPLTEPEVRVMCILLGASLWGFVNFIINTK